MRIALVSSFVPFINGGGRFIVEWSEEQLRLHGHEVERFYLPFSEEPDHLLNQIGAYRLMDFTQSCDRVIAFRPPSHVIGHPNKVVWFIHHIRAYYDLWGTPYAGINDTPKSRALRQTLIDLDTRTLGEANKLYTNSKIVASRLEKFNGLKANPLYPPIQAPKRFRCDNYGDAIVVICRVEAHKRQTLLIEAMAHTKTNVRLRLCGMASNPVYAAQIQELITKSGVQDKVAFENRWISEEEKADLLADALAVAYLPADEDFYGYPSLEGAHARKAVLTTQDAGGVLELVIHGQNGFVETPDPKALAARMDEWFADRALAKRMGEANFEQIAALGIEWPHVVEALTT